MKLSLLHKNVNTSSQRKGNLMALTGLSVRVITKSSRYAQQIIITQAGPMKLGLPELPEVELTEFHCILIGRLLGVYNYCVRSVLG